MFRYFGTPLCFTSFTVIFIRYTALKPKTKTMLTQNKLNPRKGKQKLGLVSTKHHFLRAQNYLPRKVESLATFLLGLEHKVEVGYFQHPRMHISDFILCSHENKALLSLQNEMVNSSKTILELYMIHTLRRRED